MSESLKQTSGGGAAGETEAAAETQRVEGDGNGLLGTSVDAHDVTEVSLGALHRKFC